MLSKGAKIPSPNVRGTGRNGAIHAVARTETATGGKAKTLCGKSTLVADQPVRRFQRGSGLECEACTRKVVAARVEAITDRKAQRSAKNQPAAKAAKAAKVAKAAAKAVRPVANVVPISKVSAKGKTTASAKAKAKTTAKVG